MSPTFGISSMYKLLYILLSVSSVLGAGVARFDGPIDSSPSLPTPAITGSEVLPTLLARAHVVKVTRNHKTHIPKITRSKKIKTPSVTPTTPPQITTISGHVTTITPTPTLPPPPPTCEHSGCFGSAQSFPEFHLIEATGKMTIELCTKECTYSGYTYSGLHKNDCLCATSLGSQQVEVSGAYCDVQCPGLKSETCGGKDLHGPHVKGGPSPRSQIFDVYSCSIPTTTTTPSTTSSTSSSSTADPSADMAQPKYKERDIEDLLKPSKPLESRDYTRLARGGMLKAAERKQQGNVLVKKDFGLKKSWWSKE